MYRHPWLLLCIFPMVIFSAGWYLEIKNWVLGVIVTIGMLLFPGLSVDRNLYMSSERDAYKNSYAALFIKAQSWK